MAVTAEGGVQIINGDEQDIRLRRGKEKRRTKHQSSQPEQQPVCSLDTHVSFRWTELTRKGLREMTCHRMREKRPDANNTVNGTPTLPDTKADQSERLDLFRPPLLPD